MIPIHVVKDQFYRYLLTERRVSTNTFSAYKNDIDQLVLFLRGVECSLLHEATPALLKQFLAFLHGLSLSEKTVVRKISAIKMFFGYASSVYQVDNSAHLLIFPKVAKKLPIYLSPQELEDLFSVADADKSPIGMRNKTMLYLMYVTGMRVTEIVSLRIVDLHPDNNTITVSGKGGKQRLIPVPEKIMAMVLDYLQGDARNVLVDQKKRHKVAQDTLFLTHYHGVSRRMTRQHFWGIVKDLWAKTGHQKTISPHKLRHSFATHMLKNGAHLRSLQLLLGHESLSTVQIYTHIDTSYARKLYDKKHHRS